MLYQGSWVFMSADSASEHTISISGITSVVKRIDHKFLPVVEDDMYGVVKNRKLFLLMSFQTRQINQK